jgi:hypothetical protein
MPLSLTEISIDHANGPATTPEPDQLNVLPESDSKSAHFLHLNSPGGLLLVSSDLSRSKSPEIKEKSIHSSALESGFIGSSPPLALSDHESMYRPFLQRLDGSLTPEISDLSISGFKVAGMLLDHHTQAYDIPYLTLPFLSRTHESTHHLLFFNRRVKHFQIQSHEDEPHGKRDQKMFRLYHR